MDNTLPNTVTGGSLSEAVKFAHEFRQMSPGSKEKDEDVKSVTPPLQQQQQQHSHLPHQPFFASMPQHFANPGKIKKLFIVHTFYICQKVLI